MNRKIIRTKLYLLSLKHLYMDGFIFIHINKTGGSSIEKALKIPFEHKTSQEKIMEIGRRRWDRKFSFSVIRNPWDKVVSHYHYRVKTNQTNLQDSPIGFNEWVKRTYRDQDHLYYDIPKMFMPQIDWLSDKNGVILVKEIIHFENLEKEFNRVLEKIGRTATLPHVKKSNHRNYKEYYTNETVEIIRNWFQEDIERFGYSFEN